jgi:TetR/AcrR family transcriptional regulator, repressor for uid operon
MVKAASQYKTEVRERILQSAIDTFSQYGFDKTRMEDIAEAAKLAKGTLYLYFKSKEDLFYAICDRDLNKLKDQLSDMFTTKQDFLSDVGMFYDNYRKMTHDGEKVIIEALAESSRNPKLRKTLYKQKMKIFYTIIKYLDLKIEKGFFRKGVDASAIATGLVALYDGLTINNLLGVNEPYNKKAWTETVKALISGIS